MKKNFTLVELLIVIAIIVILAGILVPALRSSRETAKRGQCISQQKNIGVLIQNYAFNNNRKLNALESYRTWYIQLIKTGGGTLKDETKSQTKKDNLDVTAQGIAKLFKCPSDITKGTASYGRNDPSQFWTIKKDSNARLVTSKVSDLQGPSDLIIVADRWSDNHTPGETTKNDSNLGAWPNGGEYDTVNAFNLRYERQVGDYDNYAARHNGLSPILFVDNHVVSMDYKQTVPGYSASEIRSLMNWTQHAYGQWSDDRVLKRKK